MASKPAKDTMKLLRKQGMIVAMVEKWNPHVGPHGIRQDLWGFADLIAFHPERPGVALVQCCAGSGLAAHRDKILANETAREWVKDNDRVILLVSWSRRVPRNPDNSFQKNKDGTRKKAKWTERIDIITWGDFPSKTEAGF